MLNLGRLENQKLPTFYIITPQIPTRKAPNLFLVWLPGHLTLANIFKINLFPTFLSSF